MKYFIYLIRTNKNDSVLFKKHLHVLFHCITVTVYHDVDTRSYSLTLDENMLSSLSQAWQKARSDGWERSFCEKNFLSQGTMDMILGMRTQLLGQLRAIGQLHFNFLYIPLSLHQLYVT